jgi:sporulation protein YlmC with PRC-barrel domain
MKRFAIPAISLAALMASAVAFAQTTPDQQPSTQPAQEMQQKQDPATQAPTTPDPSKSSEQPKTDTTTAAEQPAAIDPGLAVKIDAGKSVLATSFIGSSVYTATDENIGDINDMIFDDKGAIQAVVVGVGGFLGMGEKDVALPLEKIRLTKDENNALKLTIQASREELENAPAFDKTLFVVKTPATGSSTTTQPTTGGSSTTQQ